MLVYSLVLDEVVFLQQNSKSLFVCAMLSKIIWKRKAVSEFCMSHCFTGQFCETAVDPCTANPCPPAAQCIANDTDRLCICSGDFKGEFCNKSTSLPCLFFITIITFFFLGGGGYILYLSVDSDHLNYILINHRLLISSLNYIMHSWAGRNALITLSFD